MSQMSVRPSNKLSRLVALMPQEVSHQPVFWPSLTIIAQVALYASTALAVIEIAYCQHSVLRRCLVDLRARPF